MKLSFKFARCVLVGTALTYASLSAATCPSALAGDLELSCTGNSYSKDGPFPTPETFLLKITGTKSAAVMIERIGSNSGKPIKAHVTANNIYQLKFTTSGFTGEYFHFTGNLFLIPNDERLISLLCKPS